MSAKSSNAKTPDWVKDAIFYQIFPDSFAKGVGPLPQPVPSPSLIEPWDDKPSLRGFKGGNLWGVIEKLDHIVGLGFNAIYFCPLFSSPANHRYHTTDYFLVDPLLGGNEAFDAMLEAAHAKGLKVVLDAVLNHSSRGHFAFQHVMQNGKQSPYRDWFHFHDFPVKAYNTATPNYDAWWGIPELPKFNTSNPECREYLLQVAEFWMKKGIDGWRLDVPNEINDDAFWQEFRRRVKAINPEAYIVGEIWDDATRWLQGDQFDAVMNYPLSRAILGFVGDGFLDAEIATNSGLNNLESLNALACSHRFEELFERYPWEIVCAQMNLLTTHDTPRVLSLFKNNEVATALGLAMLFTLPGSPTVYYGDEVGLPGHHDPDNRRAMPWDPSAWSKPIVDSVRDLSAIRGRWPMLRRGEYQRLHASVRHLAFARTLEGESLVVAVNAGAEPWDVKIGLHGLWSRGEAVREIRSGRLGKCSSGNLIGGTQAPFSLEIWAIDG